MRMKKFLAAILVLAMAALCACGAPGAAETTNAITTTEEAFTTEFAVTTEEPSTLDPNRQMAVMEPVQGGPMLYTFTGKNGKLGLINQDGELVAPPQYELPNHGDYSAEYSVDARYTYDANGRVNGITVQKGSKGEAFIHYTLDGKSSPVEGHQEIDDRNANDGLYNYSNEGTGTIYDADQKPLYTTKLGEEIIRLFPVPYEGRVVGLVVQDAEGNVVTAFDNYGKPMQSKAEAQFFMDQYFFGGTFYQFKDGKWITLDLRQFIKPDVEAHCAVSLIVTEDWLIVETGEAYESMEVDEVFAVDWNGKPYENCPLAPFMSKHGFPTAGEQGPNYYWVEQGGKRGYINRKGDWLFVEG